MVIGKKRLVLVFTVFLQRMIRLRTPPPPLHVPLFSSDEDIRGADYDNVRQMLLNLSYPTELVFERKARRGGGFVSSGASPLKQAPVSASGRPPLG